MCARLIVKENRVEKDEERPCLLMLHMAYLSMWMDKELMVTRPGLHNGLASGFHFTKCHVCIRVSVH